MSQISIAASQSRVIQPNITISGAASASGKIRITATAHGLLTGDIIQLEGIGGTIEAVGQWTITKHDANSFDLDNSHFTNAYTSGGLVQHLGFVAGSALVDSSVFPTVPDPTLVTRVESLSPGSNLRACWEDATDSPFVTAQPLSCTQFSSDNAGDAERTVKVKHEDLADAKRSFGQSGGNLRLKLFISGGAFSTTTVSSWLEY